VTPTYDRYGSFWDDYRRLAPARRARCRVAVRALVADLEAGRPPRPGLRVKLVHAAPGHVYEFSWAPDGRATSEYGRGQKPGQPHILWRRIGSHDIVRKP
jgi:hypothetical protein